MPAYRATATIGAAVHSALAVPDTEVVVAPDDGSHDYDALQHNWPGRVQVLAPTCAIGPGAGRNRAFAAARGSHITSLDADDRYEPGALEQALQLLAQAHARGQAPVAFLRTRYVAADTGQTVRELPATGRLDFAAFIAFHGSVFAVCARALWQPYTHWFSEDVLHSASLLHAAGGSAPLTHAAYLSCLRPDGVSALTDQDRINAHYQHLARTHSGDIARVYEAKLAVGAAFAASRWVGEPMGFHRFVGSLAPQWAHAQDAKDPDWTTP